MIGRVVACKEYGKPFAIEEYEVPEPAPGAVVLRMTQAGICGSDLHVPGGVTRSMCRCRPTGQRLWGTKAPGLSSSFGRWRHRPTLCGTPIKRGRPHSLRGRFPLLPLPPLPEGRHQLVRQPGLRQRRGFGPTSGAPTPTYLYLPAQASHVPACPTSFPTTICWARSTALWAP